MDILTTSALPSRRPLPTLAAAPSEPAPLGRLLARALDELDHGVLLVDSEGGVLHLNHRARRLLDGRQALQLLGLQLRASDPRDVAPLFEALQAAAHRGLRKLLTLGQGPQRQVVALVPVEPGVVAMMLGRDRVCEDLSITCFARSHALTAAETRVLTALGLGVRPAEIAREQGVKLSTVRTQIGAIREKTGAESITALVRLVAALPPMVGALRS
jgi:DNA-binding CsgD family transcriptional regulator